MKIYSLIKFVDHAKNLTQVPCSEVKPLMRAGVIFPSTGANLVWSTYTVMDFIDCPNISYDCHLSTEAQ